MSGGFSAAMVEALDKIRDAGGRVSRFAGGYWSSPHVARIAGRPAWHISTTTIEALERRGALRYVEWRDGRNGRFPVAGELTFEAELAEVAS